MWFRPHFVGDQSVRQKRPFGHCHFVLLLTCDPGTLNHIGEKIPTVREGVVAVPTAQARFTFRRKLS